MKPEKARCLMVYPWPIDAAIGSQVVLLSYARAIAEMGIAVDCFAPYRRRPVRDERGLYLGVFERYFSVPNAADEPARRLADVGSLLDDPFLPDSFGCDALGMMSAALLASAGNYDLVGVHVTRCHAIARVLPRRARRLLFTTDLDAEVLRQEEILGGPRPSYTLEDEVIRMKAFDLVTAVGPHDLAHVRHTAPRLNVVEAPFCPWPMSMYRPRTTREISLLLASSHTMFNRSSFEWFWRHVWPLVRHRVHLTVVGGISDFASKLGASTDKRVSVRGIVPSLDDICATTDVVIAPYAYGGGVKTKVIESLAQGFPVVTTSLGLTNTRAREGRDLLVADDAAGFAQAILSLADSPDLRRRLSQAATRYIETYHNPKTAFRGLQTRVKALLRAQAAEERGNGRRNPRPLGMERAVREVVLRCRTAGIRRIAVFGAGGHTEELVPLWKELGGPTALSIVVSKRAKGQKSLMGLPIVPANRFDPTTVDAIVLSSHTFEEEMVRTSRALWPRLRVFPIWRPAINAGIAPQRPRERAPYSCGPVLPSALRSIALDLPSKPFRGRAQRVA